LPYFLIGFKALKFEIQIYGVKFYSGRLAFLKFARLFALSAQTPLPFAFQAMPLYLLRMDFCWLLLALSRPQALLAVFAVFLAAF